MRPLDYVFAVLALASLTAFLGVLVYRVPQPALIAVCAIGVLLVAYDFLSGAKARRRS